MLLRQIADLGDHVVDAVVQDVLILPETVDVPHEVVVTLDLRVGCVVGSKLFYSLFIFIWKINSGYSH